MQRILLATDFSERSDRALRRAAMLARSSGARLDLVHVVDDDRPRHIVEHEAADARSLLAELAQSLESVEQVSCTVQVLLADAFAGIAQAVTDLAPDLLVIGPHRRQILRGAFVGTTAERTIRAVDCPVVMVNGPPVGPYRNVLLTTDLSETSRTALQRFGRLGIDAEGPLHILSVYSAPALRLAMAGTLDPEDQDAYLSDLGAQADRYLGAFLASLDDGHPVRVVRREETTTAHEVLKAARDLGSNLIVVSTQGKGAVARMLLGSVAEQVLQLSGIDVLAIPPPRVDP
ncbi:MAG: universal stress protein [Devosia sp.]|nr:universal stress protein [Devosia sp.]